MGRTKDSQMKVYENQDDGYDEYLYFKSCDTTRLQQTIATDIFNTLKTIENKRAFIEEAILIYTHLKLPAEVYQAVKISDTEKLKNINVRGEKNM